jgi:hypothetical protein
MRRLCSVGAILTMTAPLLAQVTPVGPFIGSLQEDYETFPVGVLPSGTNIFGGEAVLSGNSLRIILAGGFGLVGNGTAQPYSGAQAFGNNSATDLAIITFASPVTRFGGYWSHSTSGVNRFELTFKDSAYQLKTKRAFGLWRRTLVSMTKCLTTPSSWPLRAAGWV